MRGSRKARFYLVNGPVCTPLGAGLAVFMPAAGSRQPPPKPCLQATSADRPDKAQLKSKIYNARMRPGAGLSVLSSPDPAGRDPARMLCRPWKPSGSWTPPGRSVRPPRRLQRALSAIRISGVVSRERCAQRDPVRWRPEVSDTSA